MFSSKKLSYNILFSVELIVMSWWAKNVLCDIAVNQPPTTTTAEAETTTTATATTENVVSASRPWEKEKKLRIRRFESRTKNYFIELREDIETGARKIKMTQYYLLRIPGIV